MRSASPIQRTERRKTEGKLSEREQLCRFFLYYRYNSGIPSKEDELVLRLNYFFFKRVSTAGISGFYSLPRQKGNLASAREKDPYLTPYSVPTLYPRIVLVTISHPLHLDLWHVQNERGSSKSSTTTMPRQVP